MTEDCSAPVTPVLSVHQSSSSHLTTHLAVIGNVLDVIEPCSADSLIVLEWNITADHVVQEDAQAPHCQLVSVVTFLDNPLRGRVDMSSWKYLILFLINEYTSGHL